MAENIDIEKLRENHKPPAIKMLFVGESPPSLFGASRNFFYLGTGHLFEATKTAFEKTFKRTFDKREDFIKFFEEKGCYLEDLFKEKGTQVKEAVDNLSRFIKEERPKCVVAVLEQRYLNVKVAADKSGVVGANDVYVLPFPARWTRWRKQFVEGLEDIIEKYLTMLPK